MGINGIQWLWAHAFSEAMVADVGPWQKILVCLSRGVLSAAGAVSIGVFRGGFIPAG
jgi:hypothetical protein